MQTPGTSRRVEGVTPAQRLDALSYPGHPIIVVDGFCAACGREVYESGDHRGQRWRHER